MFVIQERVPSWGNKWEVLNLLKYPRKFKTLKEAQDVLDSFPKLQKVNCRIAEEYTVTRYKAANR
jgi:hypothetical protein